MWLSRSLRTRASRFSNRLQSLSSSCFFSNDSKSDSNWKSISIDRSGLINPAQVSKNPDKSKETDLSKFLKSIIETRGPISVADYFKQAMQHPEFGYYMRRDVFGKEGDFTTSPEISQMFGEIIGIWCVATWNQMGCPENILIAELGPGRGSLMSDLLRAVQNFPEMYQALDVHLVETSKVMRNIQRNTLGCVPDDKHVPKEGYEADEQMVIPHGPSVRWHRDVSSIPPKQTLFIAQELFDALPAHQFEYTTKGWCERLVDVDLGDGPDHFRFVLSNGPTLAARAYLGKEKLVDPDNFTESFQKLSEKVIKNPSEQNGEPPIYGEGLSEGDRIEVSPMSIALVQDISKRVSEHGGGALMIDYGHNQASTDSLRGIKKHKFVSVLQEPGDVDLSFDVDFLTLKRYAEKEENVQCVEAIPQGQFLKNMGIETRLAALLQSCSDDEKMQEELFLAYERLVEPDQMGSIFKTMAFVHKDIGEPVGFESLEPQE